MWFPLYAIRLWVNLFSFSHFWHSPSFLQCMHIVFQIRKFVYFLFCYLFHFWLRWVYIALRGLSGFWEWGPPLIAVRRPHAVASLAAVRRLWEARTSAVAACGLSSCWAWASLLRAYEILLDQGLNLCPLDWQADSCPLCHQGCPEKKLFLNAAQPGTGIWERCLHRDLVYVVKKLYLKRLV